jgi:hypothetical protein
MKATTIAQIAIGTSFLYERTLTWYRKTANARGHEILCEPRLGGKWQSNLAEWLMATTPVQVITTDPRFDEEG